MKKAIFETTIEELMTKCKNHYPSCKTCDFENNCYGEFPHELFLYSDIDDEIEIESASSEG